MGDDQETPPKTTSVDNEADETENVFVTALPKGNHDQDHQDSNNNTAQPKQMESQEDFFADIGYYQFLNELEQNSLDARSQEVFSKLQSKVKECQQREKSVGKLELNLKQARLETAEASRRDAVDQKRNDELVDEIRAKEEYVNTIHSSMEEKRVLVERMEMENEELKRKIDVGPGWTESQLKEKARLSEEIQSNRKEADILNHRSADLRSSLENLEAQVKEAIKQRQEAIRHLEAVEIKIDEAEERNIVEEQKVNEAEKNLQLSEASLQHLEDDLASVKKESEEEMAAVEHLNQEMEELQLALSGCAIDMENMHQEEMRLIKELSKIRDENEGIKADNESKQTDLKSKELQLHSLKKDRAKISKQIELIKDKTDENDKESAKLECELNKLKIGIDQIEQTELPMTRRDCELLKRQLKKVENEQGMVQRKQILAIKSAEVIDDLIASNESTLKTQESELNALKTSIQAEKKAKERLDSEQSKSDQMLKQKNGIIHDKQLVLKSAKESNRIIELKILDIEEDIKRQEDLCEIERSQNCSQTKMYTKLKAETQQVKHDYDILQSELRSIKEGIKRASDLIINEHRLHFDVDSERNAIEQDIVSFQASVIKLESRKKENEKIIASLLVEIDDVDSERDQIRNQHRSAMTEKDIVGARLISTQLQLEKMNARLNIKQTAMKEGEEEFDQLQNDISSEMDKNKNLLEETERIIVSNEKQKKQEEILANLEHEIAMQRDKRQKLAIELGKPINLHRWRQLQISDKNRYRLIEKIHKLQKQIVASTNNIAARSSYLGEHKKILTKMKKEASARSTVSYLESQLQELRTHYDGMNKDIAEIKAQLEEREIIHDKLKSEIVQMQRRMYDMNADYLVSLIYK